MSRGAILGLVGALALVGASWLWLQRREAAVTAVPSTTNGAARGSLETLAARIEPPEETPGSVREEVVLEEELRREPDRAPLRVRVVDRMTEAPVAGARVTLLRVEPRFVRETDEQGWCTLPASEDPWVRVEKEGFLSVEKRFRPVGEQTIPLAPVTTLFGRVLSAETHAPVPGARIALESESSSPEARSGTDGSYELPGIPRGVELRLALEADGFPQDFRIFEIRSDGERVEQDFLLERGIEISGRVVDFETGTGLAGATVKGFVTDDVGLFHGQVLPKAGYDQLDLTVEAEGYCSLMVALGLDRLREPLEFRLPRPTVVEGVVSDVEGRPIARASVGLHEDHLALLQRDRARAQPTPFDELPKGWHILPEGHRCFAQTDEQGRFRIANVVPWSRFMRLVGGAEGYVHAEIPIERVRGPGEVTWAEFVLERSSRPVQVHGRVLLNGTHLATAVGRARWSGANQTGEQPIETGEFYAEVEKGDVSFRLELDGLPAGIEGAEFMLTFEPGEYLEHDAELRMPTRPITGRVTFDDGTPSGKAKVETTCPLHGAGRAYWERLHVSTEAALDGSYLLEVPDWERAYRVTAHSHQDETSVEGIRAGASGVDLVLRRPGRVLLRVVDALTRAPLTASFFQLEWKRSNEEEFRPWDVYWSDSTPDADGWYEDWLPSDRLDIAALPRGRESGYRRALLERVLVPSTGESPRFEFALAKSPPFELRLAEPKIAIPRDHTVVLAEEIVSASVDFDATTRKWHGPDFRNSELVTWVAFDRDGVQQVFGLAPGRYLFKVFPPDLVIEPGEVLVTDAMTEPVVVRWSWSR